MIGLAKLTLIRDQDGRDRDVMGQVRPFTLRLQHALGTGQEESGTELQRVDYALRRLLEPARALCRSLLQLGIDEASLNREIGERKRILVLGGGGGAGYGYAGIFQAKRGSSWILTSSAGPPSGRSQPSSELGAPTTIRPPSPR